MKTILLYLARIIHSTHPTSPYMKFRSIWVNSQLQITVILLISHISSSSYQAVKSVQSALSDLLTTSATHGTFSRPSTKHGLILIGLELNTNARESFEHCWSYHWIGQSINMSVSLSHNHKIEKRKSIVFFRQIYRGYRFS